MAIVVPLHRTFARVAVVLLLASACGKSEGTGMTQAWNPDESSGGGESSAGEETNGPSSSPSTAASDDTPASCDDPCDAPPSDCQLAPGVCHDGACDYENALAGTPCITDCPEGGHCDAGGLCICGGGGSCAETCTAGPNQSAACDDAGTCIRTCTAPYEDCDADPSNGCEVPVGMPHQCDVNGLNAAGGCWTAYCGSMSGDGIFDFGTYHCVDCSTCAEDGAQCHWCNHDTGNWFPQEACTCGAEYLNAVCG